LVEVDELNKTERGDGGFGHTGVWYEDCIFGSWRISIR
jgi:hypothetical protein